MCGVAGILSFGANSPAEGAIRKMTAAQAHRGPDGFGYWAEGPISLGHRRLSVIDLEGGAQPMLSYGDRAVVSYNGEIYNSPALRDELAKEGYPFQTRCDTEVLLALYQHFGAAGFSRLDGMFAFALWDRTTKQLHLVRDHVGIKPLYLAEHDGSLYFASEIKGVVAGLGFRPELDAAAVNSYFARQYVRGPGTIYQSIQKLPPGVIRTFSVEKDACSNRDATFFHLPGATRWTAAEASEAVSDQLTRSVAAHLLSDVPVGVFLSGGIDSSLIVALAARHQPVTTFSVGFADRRVDELPFARQIADQFNTEHHELILTPAEALSAIPDLARSLDQPLADYAIVPTYHMSKFAREHVVVALSGEGADELFGGYPKRYAPYVGLDRTRLTRFGVPLPPLGPWLFAERTRANLLGERFVPTASLAGEQRTSALLKSARPLGAVNAALRADLGGWLVDDLLLKVDEMAMLASLETRVPFLSPDLVRLVSSMPGHLKVGVRSTKRVLREVATDLLPQELVDRPKHGFTVPVGAWLRRELRGRFEEMALASGYISPWLSLPFVRKLWRAHLGGRDHGLKLWSILIFAEWVASHSGAIEDVDERTVRKNSVRGLELSATDRNFHPSRTGSDGCLWS